MGWPRWIKVNLTMDSGTPIRVDYLGPAGGSLTTGGNALSLSKVASNISDYWTRLHG